MENYTLEEVIDAINSELTDAYTEASKEYKLAKKMANGYLKNEKLLTKAKLADSKGETDKAAKLTGKSNKLIDKLTKKYGDNEIDPEEDLSPEEQVKLLRHFIKKGQKFLTTDELINKLAEEDCCKESAEEFTEASDEYKNIKKLLNNNAKKEKDKIKSSIKNCDGKHGTCLSSQSAVLDNLMKDLSAKEKEKLVKFALKKDKGIKNLNTKVDKMALKESTMSDIYEAYCDDVIDAETAMDMILTIEASTSEALEKLKKSGEEYNNRIKTASDELEKKRSDTLSSIRDRHEKANKEIEDMKRRIDESLSTKDEEDLLEMMRKAFGNN